MAYVTVDVDLSDFSDAEIAQEYRERKLEQFDSEFDLEQRCKEFVQHIRCGNIEIKGRFGNDLVDFLFHVANKVV
jgi:hypothetical protein